MSERPFLRRRLIWLGVVVLLLMFLLPPWVYTVDGRSTGDVFYQEILPGPKPPHCAAKAICGVKVDMGRLGIQIAVWTMVFGFPLFAAWRKREKK